MRFLLAFNVVTYLINLGIYWVEPIGGTIFMFFLGCSHLIQALIFFVGFRNKISKSAKKHLEMYWIIVISWLSLLFICVNVYTEGIALYAAICMIIGIYFLYVNNKMAEPYITEEEEIK